MYTANNILQEQVFDGLQIKQVKKSEAYEILSVSLEAGHIFPEHVSHTDAQLILLEGEVYFGIDNQVFNLVPFQIFEFKAYDKHFVKALTDSKFLIIR